MVSEQEYIQTHAPSTRRTSWLQ